MKKFQLLALSFAVLAVATPARADYEDPKTYANDKLLNAEAQLERLKEQKSALEKMIKAVKKDLRAAKTRAKAERLQSQADVIREDAITYVEQSGVAIDLPDLMYSSGVKAELAGTNNITPEKSDLMFENKNKEKAVFFPNGGGIENDVVLPPDVK